MALTKSTFALTFFTLLHCCFADLLLEEEEAPLWEEEVAPLCLLQTNAEMESHYDRWKTESNGDTEEYKGKPDDIKVPSIDEVTDTLGLVNDSLDTVTGSIDSVNETAYDMLDQFLSAAAQFQQLLTTLEQGVQIAKMLPIGGAGSSAVDSADEFITTANESVAKYQALAPADVAKLSSELGAILIPLYGLADALIGRFVDATTAVQGLANLTANVSDLAEAITKDTKKIAKQVKNHDKKAGHHGHHHHKNGMALLQEHALASRGMSVSEVDRSMSGKGGSTNPCNDATSKIDKANSTLTQLSEGIFLVNSTSADLLIGYLDQLNQGLVILNATVMPALDLATDVPEKLLAPVTKGLQQIMDISSTLQTQVDSQMADIEKDVEKSTDTLAGLYSLTQELQAGVDEACKQGACGAAAAQKCLAMAAFLVED